MLAACQQAGNVGGDQTGQVDFNFLTRVQHKDIYILYKKHAHLYKLAQPLSKTVLMHHLDRNECQITIAWAATLGLIKKEMQAEWELFAAPPLQLSLFFKQRQSLPP